MFYIIVPVYNKSYNTNDFLCSLSQQSYSDLKVVIVNDGSSDDTSEVITKYKKCLDITEIKSKDQWWCGSINIGLEWIKFNTKPTSNSFIAFANNDIQFEENFFFKLEKYLQDENEVLIHPQVRTIENKFISAGSKIIAWIPFISKHPKNIKETRQIIDLGTARFLVGGYSTIYKIGFISKNLKQYQGDNDFTYRAKKMGIKTYIYRDLYLWIDNSSTGLKNDNIVSLIDLWKSFFDVRSSNNIYYRHQFLRNHFSKFKSTVILFFLTLNSFLKVISNKFR